MPIIRLNKQLKRVEVNNFEIDNEIVFKYFDKLPTGERNEKLINAIYIGVLALMEDRLSSFLAKTSNELGTELESLKLLFDLKKEIFYKTTVKGSLAEEEIVEFLNDYFSEKKINDKAYLIGEQVGKLPRNKTGDILCEIDGKSKLTIAIEVKFDKSIRLGDIETKEVFTKNIDTAWSQLLEAQVNRDSKASIIVFDISFVDSSVINIYDNVGYIKGVGFIAIVDSQKGDFTNLAISYMLARDIAITTKKVDIDFDFFSNIVNRIIRDISEILKIKRLVENNIATNIEILKQLEKSMLLMKFNQKYFAKYLQDGKLDKQDQLDYYQADEIKDKYKLIEKEINKVPSTKENKQSAK